MARGRRKKEYPVKKKKTPARIIFGWLFAIFAVVLVLSALSPVIGVTLKAGSGAMSPSIEIGETVIINRIAYLLLPPKRGDIIQFKTSKGDSDTMNEEDSSYIRRIVGLPGETIQISEGNVYINGKPLTETYRSGEMTYSGTATTSLTLSNDQYFVMADNRSNNFDSRDSTVGPVSGKDIIGKVWLKLLPLDELGLL